MEVGSSRGETTAVTLDLRPYTFYCMYLSDNKHNNNHIRGEIAPPIRAYDKGGILINNSSVQFR